MGRPTVRIEIPSEVERALTGRCPLLGAQNTDSQKEGA